MSTKAQGHPYYSRMPHSDDHLFSDEQIQRYDADTIQRRYGEHWRNYASNVREITQADGSIVKEYIIDDPSILKDIQPSADSASSTTGSDDEQQSSRYKFAQIKAKFEQKSSGNVMTSASPSSVASSQSTTRQNSSRRTSNDSLTTERPTMQNPDAPALHADRQRTGTNGRQSMASETSNTSSSRRLNSVDEADEEVRRLHRLNTNNDNKGSSNVQYEIVDEDGNPMAIDGVHDLIKMSGVTAREVAQPDGSIVREYVIDDPQLLSKFQSHRVSGAEGDASMTRSRYSPSDVPPPPPRIPLKQPMLHRPSSTGNGQPAVSIQEIRVVEPNRRYEYITTAGRRIEFMITNFGQDESKIQDSDVREVTQAINTRLMPSSSANFNAHHHPFTLPKQWNPAVDLTHRQRTGSDNQLSSNSNAHYPSTDYQRMPSMAPNLARSASNGALHPSLHQTSAMAPVYAEPIIDWSLIRQQDPHGQVDPAFVQQFINQRHQHGGYQTSAQFLPEQQQNYQQQQQQPPPKPTSSMHSPMRNNVTSYYQQPSAYPYQGQQQHGVRIVSNHSNGHFDQGQQGAMMMNGHARI